MSKKGKALDADEAIRAFESSQGSHFKGIIKTHTSTKAILKLDDQINKLSEDDQNGSELVEEILRVAIKFQPIKQSSILNQIKEKTGVSIATLRAQLKAIRRESRREAAVDAGSEICRVPGYTNHEFVMSTTGIYEEIRHATDEGMFTEISPLWRWEQFEVTAVLMISDGTKHYNLIYNGGVFENYTLESLMRVMDSSHMSAQSKHVLGFMIDEYIKTQEVPQLECAPVCGFTKDGWRLPGEYIIDFAPGQQPIKLGLLEMLAITTSEQTVKRLVQRLYESITIDHKGVFFSFIVCSPFFYALKPVSGIVPFLALASTESSVGKSANAKLSSLFWNNLGTDEILSKNTLESEARAGEYLTASTLATIVDDVGDIDAKIMNTLKSSASNKVSFKRLNKDHNYNINKEYISPLIYTYNLQPELLNDNNYRTNGIIIPVSYKPTAKERTKFDYAKQNIQRGLVGKYVYEVTNTDGFYKELEQMYFIQPNLPRYQNSRQNAMYKLILLGKQLAKKFFDIDIDVSDAPKLIFGTLGLGNDEIFNIVQGYIIENLKIDWDDVDSGKTKGRRANWITVPLPSKYRYKNKAGVFLTSENVTDICNRMHVHGITKQSMTRLAQTLQSKWNSVSIGSFKMNFYKKNVVREAIFIPSDDSGIYIPWLADEVKPSTEWDEKTNKSEDSDK